MATTVEVSGSINEPNKTYKDILINDPKKFKDTRHIISDTKPSILSSLGKLRKIPTQTKNPRPPIIVMKTERLPINK